MGLVSVGALLILFLSTWASYQLQLGLATAGFFYLVSVVVTAIYGGFWAATVVSLSAVVLLNYFFVPPTFTLIVATWEDWMALCAFEFTALVVSRLSHAANKRAAEAIAERRGSERLYQTAQRILLSGKVADPGSLLTSVIQEVFDMESVVLFDAELTTTYRAGTALPEIEQQVRNAYVADSTVFDATTQTWFCALRVERRPVGALALVGGHLSSLIATGVASLCAVALERYRSLQRELKAEAGRQSEQLRAAVLDALGHEFKTPVTTIWAASSGLLELGGFTEMQTELLTLIDEESQKLNDLATRLLRTAKLDGTQFEPKAGPMLLSKLAAAVLQDLPKAARDRILLSAPIHEMLVLADHGLLAAALSQLIDNALKYSNPGSPISVYFSDNGTESTVSVLNRGPVIEAADRERIFERFYRAGSGENGPAGTGLGLSIVKRIVAAHHGRVWAESDARQGTIFSIAVPAAGEPKHNRAPRTYIAVP